MYTESVGTEKPEKLRFVPQESAFSTLCHHLPFLGFRSEGFSTEMARDIASIISFALSMLPDPEWSKLVKAAGLSEEYALNLSDKGILLYASVKTNQTSQVLLASEGDNDSYELLEEIGERISEGFRFYAEQDVRIPSIFTELDKNIDGFNTARSHHTFLYQVRQRNGGKPQFNEKVLDYFDGWITPNGYTKLLSLRDELESNRAKYFGFDVEATKVFNCNNLLIRTKKAIKAFESMRNAVPDSEQTLSEKVKNVLIVRREFI